MQTSYETERLILKVLDTNYSEEVLDYIIRNKDFFSKYEPNRDKDFYSATFQADELKNDLKYIQTRNMLRLWIFRKDRLNKIIGQVTFYNIVPFAFLSCHIGYKSDANEVNKGIITEAVKRGINIMFSEYGMHRIEAYVLPNNKASIRVLEKIGFTNEGIARKFLEVNGVWEDHLHFAFINSTD